MHLETHLTDLGFKERPEHNPVRERQQLLYSISTNTQTYAQSRQVK